MVDTGTRLAAFTQRTVFWCTLDDAARWKMLTRASDSSHGRDNAVVFAGLKLLQSKDPFSVSCYQTNDIIRNFLWWYHILRSLKGKNIMNQNCSIAISPWWVSHLWLIKNSNIHFCGTSCLVCPTSLLPVSVFLFATLKAAQIFTELLLISAFPRRFCFLSHHLEASLQLQSDFLLYGRLQW